MLLPGGLLENGVEKRDWAFRPANGALELRLAEVVDESGSMPQAVTLALSIALDRLAGGPATRERTAALCVADRQFLMRELERHLGFEQGWFHSDCPACGAQFDFLLDYRDLPIQLAGDHYPFAEVEVEGKQMVFRLPTGADQEILANIPEEEATDCLVRRLACEPETLETFDEKTVTAIEDALDRTSPAIVLAIQAACPECNANTEVNLDPYRALRNDGNQLLQDVHQIASHYHWSEADILELPRNRRLRYLELIDQTRGMVR